MIIISHDLNFNYNYLIKFSFISNFYYQFKNLLMNYLINGLEFIFKNKFDHNHLIFQNSFI